MNNNIQIHSILNNKVSAINKKLNDISRGGCGRFALELHKALKNHGIACSIVLVDYCHSKGQVDRLIASTGKSGINSTYQHLFKDGEDPGVDTCNGHVCVKFDGKLYDNRGEYPGAAISDHITPKTMEQFLSIDCWNDTFRWSNVDNSDIIGTMEQFFERLFNKHLANTTKGDHHV